MTLITRRNPGFEDFPSLRLFEDSVQRLFSDFATPSGRPWSPPVDIVETENDLVLTADVPGVKMEDIDIKLEDGTLTITGSREFQNSESKGGYHRLERSYGSFQRAFSLPDSVDAEKVEASYENGVLKVVLPKKEVAKPRSIKVNLSKN
jgi:HSP20 family protein